MNNIICVAGPTASGKTALAVELAKMTNGEVVSCDSMQIYRRMDIGTAKPTKEEMQGIPHHMIDICEPEESFSVDKYCRMAAPIVDGIVARGKTAIIAGGTGLYMDSLVKGNDFAAFPSTGHRERLEQQLADEGLEALISQLRPVDPEALDRSQNNPRRIIRALEVFYETGETITSHNLRTQAVPPRYDPLWIGLDFDPRALLYERVNLRVGLMLEMGLEKEIRDLLSGGISPACTAMQAIGYKEFIDAIEGRCSWEEAADNVRMFSRRYAKRQLSWFRRNEKIHWLTRTADISAEEIIESARRLVLESDN